MRAMMVMGFIKVCPACMLAPGRRKEMLEVFWQSYFKMTSALFLTTEPHTCVLFYNRIIASFFLCLRENRKCILCTDNCLTMPSCLLMGN